MNDRPTLGIAVFVWKDDKFLMVKRTGAHGEGTWSVPGGHFEYGESFNDCAARETLEETGIKIDQSTILAITNDIFADTHKHSVSLWVRSNWLSGKASIMEPDKILDLRWATFHDLPAPLFEPCWQHLREAKPELFH